MRTKRNSVFHRVGDIAEHEIRTIKNVQAHSSISLENLLNILHAYVYHGPKELKWKRIYDTIWSIMSAIMLQP